MEVKKATKSQGFTLIELLLALGLGSILLLGIVTTVFAINKSYSFSQDYLKLQDDIVFINTSFIVAARQANAIINQGNVETSNTKLSFLMPAHSTSCLFNQPTANFNQSYYLEGDKLVCEVSNTATANKETLAYSITNLSFLCAEVERDTDIEYSHCSSNSLDIEKVRSIKISYTVNKTGFVELKKDIENTHVITLSH